MEASHLRLSLTILFIIFLSYLQFVTPSTYLLHICNDTSTYTENSKFANNLNLLLQNHQFSDYYDWLGEGFDSVIIMRFCSGNISLRDCYSCIQSAGTRLTQVCPNQKGAIIYYLDCYLQYASSYLSSTESMNLSIYSNSTYQPYNDVEFRQPLASTMGSLIGEAAFSLTPTYTTEQSIIAGSRKLYCSVECLSQGFDCYNCLQTALVFLLSNCSGNEWALFYSPPCQMRYSLDPFYEMSPSPALPPSGLPANRVFDTVPSSSSQTPTERALEPASSPLSCTFSEKERVAYFITTFSLAATLAMLVIFIGTFFLRRKIGSLREAARVADVTPLVQSLQFNLASIKAATNNFSGSNKLGEGGYGPVYKGVLLSGQEIAVKKLSGSSRQGQQEFKNEVLLLARLRHKNLVSLLGFCLQGKEKLLVYEFMVNNSLDCFIFDPIGRVLLDWRKRNKIIVGIALGLRYLHEDSEVLIIHRDLKPSNILLDAEMNPKISDFGTARLMISNQSHYTASKIMGTIGYMAPEYPMRGHFSVKSDVFSFGVMLLEILHGRRISNFHGVENGENLLSYAWKSWMNNAALDIVDPIILAGNGSELLRCIHIGLLCVQGAAVGRPTMTVVVKMLTIPSFVLPPPSKPAFFVPERSNMLHNVNSKLTDELNQSATSQWSENDVPITELVAP